MAIVLNGAANSRYLSQSSAVVSAVPLTIACWYNPANVTTQNVMVTIANTSTSNDKFSLGVQNTGVVQASSVQAGTPSVSNTVGTVSIGTWFHCAAVFASSTSRTAYLNGTAATANTASSTPGLTGAPITAIGVSFSASTTPVAQTNGSIAFVAIWNAALSAANITSLAGGAYPNTILPGNLIALCNCIPGNLSPEPDSILGTGWTVNNGPIPNGANPPFYIDSPITITDTSNVLLAFESGYTASAVIGNTGTPTTTLGRVPFRILGVALDSSNNVYTCHDFDEVHNDVNFWSDSTGLVTGTTQHIYSQYEFDALSVEPNGTIGYMTGWDNTVSPGGQPPFKLAIMKIDLVNKVAVTFSTAGAVITGGSLSTASTTGLLPIVVSGSFIWVCDNNAGLLLSYNKATGVLNTSTSVTAPRGIAVDGSGQIWVGLGTSINIYSSAGVFVATPLTGLTTIYALYITGTTLAVADRGTNLVTIYTISGNTVTLSSTSPSFTGAINDVALDSSGNILVCEGIGAVNGGARFRKFNSSWVVQWTQTCTEFQSCTGYSPATPNVFVSLEQQVYNVNRSTMVATWSGTANNPNALSSPPNGPIKVLTLGGNDFEYASIGSGALGSDVISIYKRSGGTLTAAVTVTNPGNWAIQFFGVDDAANVWLAVVQAAGVNTNSVWKMPFGGLSGGNPVYSLSNAFQVVTEAAIRSALSFPTGTLNVQYCNFNSSDQLIYIGVYANGKGPTSGPFNMGFNNLLAATTGGSVLWFVTLSSIGVGMAVMPGGGVITGSAFTGVVSRWTSSGAPFGTIIVPQKFGVTAFPESPGGQLDFYGALNAQLAPNGTIDVFVEDDYNGRTFWYTLLQSGGGGPTSFGNRTPWLEYIGSGRVI